MAEVIESDEDFLNQLLLSDEALFHFSGEVDGHNYVYWSVKQCFSHHDTATSISEDNRVDVRVVGWTYQPSELDTTFQEEI